MFFFSQKEPLRDFPFGTNSRSSENGKKIVAEIETDFGVMKIELWPEVAPKTVSNFIKLSQEGFYDGTAFHRIISGFMIQGGDPLTKDPANFARYGTGGPGYTIPAEFNDRPHVRGVISMARSSDPNSAGSQFFICHGDAPFLDRQYTAFGRLIEGDEVLDKIAAVPVNISPSGERSQPTQRVEVRKIRILNLQ
ncbi:MAG: peptidylprolyl isomerase [Methylacidiphilales bacterium]|nr:peptidylprolyl isomerase [Candidatus Methylacidiphilales bacterium]